jgi:hypothetical protein
LTGFAHSTRDLLDVLAAVTERGASFRSLGNMRELGVRSFHVSCWNCHHQAVLSAVAGRMTSRCMRLGPAWSAPDCGIVGADARPNSTKGNK